MKVGILTFHFSDNYGALLQAYGLREFLLRAGVDAEFLPYHPSYVEEGGAFFFPKKKSDFKKLLKSVYLRAVHLKGRLFGHQAHRALFENFRIEHLGVGGEQFRSAEDFKARAALDYDVLITGSDQVWNPSDQIGVDLTYFLDIPRAQSCRRISYAASFGRSNVEPVHYPAIKHGLKCLDGISVREESAVALVEELTGLQPAWVPDPTILLGDFSSLLALKGDAPVCAEPYVFCYALRSDKGVREIAEAVQQKEGGRILSAFNPHRRWREIGETHFGGPIEWLQALHGARAVVTNSFHGVVFAILMEKPFVAVGLPGGKAALGERIRSLLERTGLSERFVPADRAAEAMSVMNVEIDWGGVRGRLADWQADARQWLVGQVNEGAKRG